jgi:DNA helicase-2/ATP-dependent DNA helicase PcrA
MDYDDLLLLFRELLKEKETVRNHLNEQYRYVMVDEYQDTNAIQADIINYLARDHGNVMVVGDDSQSIYSFRGASYKNMFDFPKLFPKATIVKLEENYRSTQPILFLTNALMAQAREKYTKCLYTRREGGDIPEIVDTKTEQGQARFVCDSILNEIQKGRSLKDFAVLFRAGYHSFELEMQLAKYSIPFVKYGGFKFIESAHIKDLLAHLRVLVNRNDTVSWGRILRLLKNIGQRKSQLIIRWLKESGIAQKDVGTWPGRSKKDDALKKLSRLLEKLSQRGVSPEKATSLVLAYYEPILEEKFDDFPRRKKDLEQLMIMASRYRSLRAFLDELVLDPPNSMTDVVPRGGGENLTLSTVHSAKGLEWPVVFVIWVADGYFPPMKTLTNDSAMEEERRLLYVAATRAKDRLILCYPGQETHQGWQMSEFRYRGGLSSFIQSLPEDVVAHRQTSFLGGHTGFQPPKRRRHQRGNKDEGRGLRPGDRVRHPAFGQGVIAKFLDPQKVEVLFRDVGKKLLHLAYTTLEKV